MTTALNLILITLLYRKLEREREERGRERERRGERERERERNRESFKIAHLSMLLSPRECCFSGQPWC